MLSTPQVEMKKQKNTGPGAPGRRRSGFIRSSIVGAVFLLIAAGCGGGEEELPLSDDKLVMVLTDVHVAEAALQHLSGPIKDSMAEVYYEQVMTMHGIERDDFDTCIVRLRENPERLQYIYGRVQSRIDTLQVSGR